MSQAHKDHDVARLWTRFKEHGDASARDQLILAYSPLVKYVAGRMGSGLPAHVEDSDLISYGLLGLIGALERFDPSRNIRFETYAISRIKGSIIDELRALDWVPRSVRSWARQVERAVTKLENQLHRAPPPPGRRSDRMPEPADQSPIRLGISSCLLGEPVRWDGAGKRDHFLVDELGRFVEWVPVCPEVEAGLGVPREPMRLVGDPASPRLTTVRTGIDRTQLLRQWAEGRVRELETEGLCGFVFKKDSPSSGLTRVKVYPEPAMADRSGPELLNGTGRAAKARGAGAASAAPIRQGVGLFAQAFVEHFPALPVEDEGRLTDPDLRENFIERVFTLRRWREQVLSRPGRGPLVAFHSTHKLLLLAHSTEHYRGMGRLVAEAKAHDLHEVLDTYQRLLLTALALRATPRKHVNVLQHAMGYFKKVLTADEKQELLEVIESFGYGLVPLIVPVTLLNHHVRHFGVPYLAEQYYLHPHPLELKLRNHV